MLDNFDCFRFMRLIWVLDPIIRVDKMKTKVFEWDGQQREIDRLDPARKVQCLYMQHKLVECMRICKKSRQIYLTEKANDFKKS